MNWSLLLLKSLAVKLETAHKPATNQLNHPQTSQTNRKPAKSQILDKPPTKQPIMSRKSVFYVIKNFSDNAKRAKFATIFTPFH